MNRTNIEYLDYTWNPVHGCDPVSSGCRECWARDMSKRLAAMGVKGYDKADPFKVVCMPNKLNEPVKKKKPAVIGVAFMGDLFHRDVQWNFQYKVFEMMCLSPQHTFIVLTKRPDIMRKAYDNIRTHMYRNYSHTEYDASMPHVILGVSVEDQKTADERIPILLETEAKTKIVSAEPLLAGINMRPYLPHLNQIIAGCESGSNRRHFEEYWALSLMTQCIIADTPYFFKQTIRKGKLVKMPELNGRVWAQMPEVK